MPLFYIKYDSPVFIKLLHKAETYIRYAFLRPIFSWILWLFRGKEKFMLNSTTISGKPLKKGISFVMPAKDEEYTIRPCLESLIGVIDQFILIDNGSKDETLKIMKVFRERMAGQAEVIVLERPGATLLDMRQEGLSMIKYNWMIRGDADMVFTEEIKKIRDFALKQKRASAIFLNYFNLYGDLNHKHRIIKPTRGEYYLRNFDSSMKVVEYFGRYEHAKIPLYYKMIKTKNIAFFHIDCSKPNERLIYRTCYLDWREAKNTQKNVTRFEEYQKEWTLHNFGTLEPKSLNYRYSRLIASACNRLQENELKELPATLKKQSKDSAFRFFIEYQNGKPHLRHDRLDLLGQGYKPSFEDLKWVPSMEKFKSDKIRKRFKTG